MHLNFIIGLVVFLNATQGVAVAQAKGNKYAVVDMQKVILNVEDGKVARAKLEKEMKAKKLRTKISKNMETKQTSGSMVTIGNWIVHFDSKHR